MNLIDLLEELRKRIIVTFVAFIIFLLIAFVFVRDIQQFLLQNLDDKLALLSPGDILWIYMVIAGGVAVTCTIPVAAYQAWKFVKLGLTKEEQKATLLFIPGLLFLFVAGVGFGYFVLFPIVLTFLQNLAGDQFETFFTADKYFRFMINLTLPFGFLFEMPAIIMFLTKLGLLNPHKLVKARKMSYFILVVISVLVTPPDFVSDILIIVPLLFLYECSITLSKFVYRKSVSSQAAIVPDQASSSN